MTLISVAVPVPFLDALTYNVPDGLDVPPVGARIRVSVGNRPVTGCVIDHCPDLQIAHEIKDIEDIVDSEAFLPAHIVDLCRWVADYYVAGIGDAIGAAMPPGAQARASSFKKRRVAAL